MVRIFLYLILLAVLQSCSNINYRTADQVNLDTLKSDVYAWITNPVNRSLFQQYNKGLFFDKNTSVEPAIIVDTSITYQTIDGFGNCLTGGSAILIHKIDQVRRNKLLRELFDTTGYNIGISYLRLSIGASDLSDHVFSYDDMPSGQTDTLMTSFSLDAEKADLIPVLKEILAINPGIRILGSPWSAPAWMKTNDSTKGGSLKPEYFHVYARYFVKYIQGMKAEGINIDAITIQNEPLNAGNNPSMYMSATDQAAFIKGSLGPAFQAEGITTKIIVYDHNADHIEYPLSIFSDPDASKYVDGVAFHLYAGPMEALTQVHNMFPSKNIYFTEQWVGAPGSLKDDIPWHIKNLVIGATANWSRNVLEWNLASDPYYNPHTPGGCDQCLGTVTIDANFYTRNPAYYVLAHSAKFVRPGSVRVSSDTLPDLPNVAFVTPSGKKVLIVLNESPVVSKFYLRVNRKSVALSLPGRSVGTYVWK